MPVEKKLQIPVMVDALLTPGHWLRTFAVRLQSHQRLALLARKEFHERLSTVLVAAAYAVAAGDERILPATGRVEMGADGYVVHPDGKGVDVQVVSTKLGEKRKGYRDITERIWECIQKKHLLYGRAASDVNLVVFVADMFETFNVGVLRERLRRESICWAYWVVAPVGPDNACSFVVVNVATVNQDPGYGLVIDFTQPGPLRIVRLSTVTLVSAAL